MVNMFLNSVVFVYDTCVLLVFFLLSLFLFILLLGCQGIVRKAFFSFPQS